MITFTVNGQAQPVRCRPRRRPSSGPAGHPRTHGHEYGCGVALCGACTVLVDGQATRCCILPVKAVQGKRLTTIEGLSADGSHPLQKAWIAHEVPQCGYCQTGMIMAAGRCSRRSHGPRMPTIDAAMTNICRCGTYNRVRQAIHTAAKT